ncbi:MAG: DUF1223 domain-containing protein [Pseudomonadota bacterium]
MRTCLLICLLAVPAAHAAHCASISGDTRARLVELYTSEGCSSCPPADRWLSNLPREAGVIPLAFHVDYWDRLGWKDPYGQVAFSQRQRMRNAAAGWIYTPQVMLDGMDFRGWMSGLPRTAAAPALVRLALAIEQTPVQLTARVDARFASSETARGAQLYLALYENRLRSTVTAGENARRTLDHDHVVRALAGPFRATGTRHRFDLLPDWKAPDLAVAAFMVDARGGTLQALAQPACP